MDIINNNFCNINFMDNNFKFKIVYKFVGDRSVVNHIATGEMSLPQNDYYFRHKATIMAMQALLDMPEELKANKKLVDFKIIWEE